MLTLLTALAFRVIRGHDPAWLMTASIVSAAAPILLTATHTLPNAVRLGGRSGNRSAQTALARSIWRDHLASAVGIATFLTLWVVHDAVP
jgi:hypothetical protein